MCITTLSQSELTALLSYDSETGIFTWKVRKAHHIHVGDIAGEKTKRGYIAIGINRQRHYAHRLAWLYVHGEWPTLEIDHINGDGMDNRINNLRQADHNGNMHNVRKAQINNRSGFLGVSYSKRNASNPWVAEIWKNRKKIYLGYYSTPEQAHAAYLEAKRRLHPTCSI
jgi:hypothetical protein